MFEHAVKNKYIIDGKIFKLNESDLHIAFGISVGFTHPVGVLITSILENNKNLNVSFHIFIDGDISPKEYNRFNLLAKKYNCNIIIYKLDNNEFKGLDDKEFTIAAYYRFAIPYQLKEITNKFLYLDADMIMIQSISSLLKINFCENIACVVEDFKLGGGRPILTPTNTGYFNSGMMYINLTNWINNSVSEKCMNLLCDVNKNPELKQKYGYVFRCFDQDALNVILKNHIIHLMPKYNFLCNISLKHNKNLKIVPDDTIIIHYHGFNKPWHEWCFHPLSRYFRKYKELSPWKNEPLDTEPTKYRQMRLYAEYFIKKGNITKSIYWLIKSVRKKYNK